MNEFLILRLSGKFKDEREQVFLPSDRTESRGDPGDAAPASRPDVGDVLVSRRTARADRYEISVLPSEAHMVATRYQEAMQKVRELARGLAVDGWYTADHTHFARIARHRV